ncbi:hypothetical protein F4779DRAFT_561778 [Xylariaceae sp. FL0662B]|nr:hypothetical protein F4779DRAFT_561778 [Xylariaceae sp. FL0662B]
MKFTILPLAILTTLAAAAAAAAPSSSTGQPTALTLEPQDTTTKTTTTIDKRSYEQCCICIAHELVGGRKYSSIITTCYDNGHCEDYMEFRATFQNLLTCASQYAPYLKWTETAKQRWLYLMRTEYITGPQ